MLSKSTLRSLTMGAAPSVLLALAGGAMLSRVDPFPRAFAFLTVALAALLWTALVFHRRCAKPIEEIRSGLRSLRTGARDPRKDLPIHREDELGALAWEIALVAGEWNASELHRLESEMLNVALAEAIPDSLFRVDRDGLVRSYRPPKQSPSFLSCEPAPGHKIEDVLPESIAAATRDAVAAVFVEDAPQLLDFELEVDGEPRTYEGRVVRAGQNEALVMVRDATRQRRTTTSRDRLHSILDATLDPILTTTPEGEIRYVNPAGIELLGLRDARALRPNLRDVLPDWVHRQIFRSAIPAAEEDGSWEGESALLSADGIEVPISLTAVAHPAPSGSIELVSFVARDLSERKRFDDHLSFLADHDPLTSLFTRRRFVEELSREIARAHRSGAGGAVLVMDLDDFKHVNDTVGHRTGDRLLVSLSHVLRKAVRGGDVLARLDGNEFAILVTETRPSRVDFVAERMLKAVRNHFVQEGDQPVGVTASLGIAFFPEHGSSAEELLGHADRALDLAKQQGGDQFVVFKPDASWKTHVDSRLAGERLIRDAISRGRFVLHAQPIVAVGTNVVMQYEILLRMLDDQDELLYPAAFLGQAERFGLVRSVDRWVVRQAIGLMGRERRRGRRLALSVNLSGKSLGDLDLTTLIEEELAQNGVEASQLTLEITETAAICDTERAKIFAIALKQIGCWLALDDFGVGFSSMNHLKLLPIDYLKIDGSFIQDLLENKVDQHLVRAMVEVAKALRKRTVAEFVGNDATVRLLQYAGVDYVQGFHIGKPAPVEDLLSGRAEVEAGARASVETRQGERTST